MSEIATEIPAQDRSLIGSHSPCIGVCVIDAATATCSGCARTSAEIGAWMTASEAEKRAVWDALPDRMRHSGQVKHISPLSPEGILEWAADLCLTGPSGFWLTGDQQSTNTFATVPGTSVVATRTEQGLTLNASDDSALTLAFHDKLRLFIFGTVDAPYAYVLTLPKGRMADQPHAVFAAIVGERRGTNLALDEVLARCELPSWAGVVAVFVPSAADIASRDSNL